MADSNDELLKLKTGDVLLNMLLEGIRELKGENRAARADQEKLRLEREAQKRIEAEKRYQESLLPTVDQEEVRRYLEERKRQDEERLRAIELEKRKQDIVRERILQQFGR